MEQNQKRRDLLTYEIWSQYRGALMGFAILSVIFFHFVKDYRTLHETLPEWMLFYFQYFGSSGVDIFLFLSGLGLYYSFRRKNGEVNLKYYLITKLSKVLIPYLLIGIPASIARRIFRQGKDLIFVVKDPLFIHFFEIGESWFWYIGMISFCYVIFPLLYRYVEKADTNLKELLRFTILFGLVTAGCHFLSIYYVELYKNINGAILRFFPFILGTFVGKRAYEKKPLTWVNVVWILPWLYFCSYAKNKNILIMRYMLACNGLMVCFFLCLIFFCFQRLKGHPVQRVLEYVGKYTLELYLTHVTLRVVMSWYGWQPGTYKKEGVMILLAVMLSAVIHVAAEWIQRWIQSRLSAI